MMTELYNPDIKLEYLSTLAANTKRFATNIFANAAPMEELYEKDLYDFLYNDFVLLFEKMNCSLGSRIAATKSQIKNYITWAIAHGYCNENVLIEITRVNKKDITGAYMTNIRYFRDIDDLYDCIRSVYSCIEDDPCLYEPTQALYGLVFYEFSLDDIYNLKVEDVQNNKIFSREYQTYIEVDNRTLGILQRASKYEYLLGIDGRRRKYKNMGYVIKSVSGLEDEPVDYNIISSRNRVWKKIMEENMDISNKYYGKLLSTEAICRCGFFNRLYNIESQGKEITLAIIEKEYRWSDIQDISKKNMACNRLMDYKKWKDVYNL